VLYVLQRLFLGVRLSNVPESGKEGRTAFAWLTDYDLAQIISLTHTQITSPIHLYFLLAGIDDLRELLVQQFGLNSEEFA